MAKSKKRAAKSRPIDDVDIEVAANVATEVTHNEEGPTGETTSADDDTTVPEVTDAEEADVTANVAEESGDSGGAVDSPESDAPQIAAPSLALFGPPALLDGEDGVAYDELLSQVSGEIKPLDILERIWVRDFVDLAWEILRLRRMKVQLLAANKHRGLKEILDRLCGHELAEELVAEWVNGDDDAIDEVEKWLAGAGMSEDEVIAQTLSIEIEDVERIDRMIMNAEARRNIVVREVVLHRSALGQRLRDMADSIADAELVEINPRQIKKQ